MTAYPRILVLGASGLIGRYLTDDLRRRDQYLLTADFDDYWRVQRAIDAAVDADAQSCVTASLARYPILWSCRPSRPMRRTCRPDCGPDTPCACGPHAAC